MLDDLGDIVFHDPGRHSQLPCDLVVRQPFEAVEQKGLSRPLWHFVERAAQAIAGLLDENELVQAGSGVVDSRVQCAKAFRAPPGACPPGPDAPAMAGTAYPPYTGVPFTSNPRGMRLDSPSNPNLAEGRYSDQSDLRLCRTRPLARLMG